MYFVTLIKKGFKTGIYFNKYKEILQFMKKINNFQKKNIHVINTHLID